MARKLSAVIAALPEDRREIIRKRTAELRMEMNLRELRRGLGISQKALAAALDVSQATVSKQERSGDMQISTLCQIVHALGGTLRITAQLPGRKEVEITPFSDACRV
ncbi:helix-turn-helix transcriptional regulator [Nitratidesulfovibrio termitidis]|uniref:helix-turn-helix transcriptional regulator n=1 Tax=Nitratidesulfovibrio termitidis TaxID=42252 RepID=UPI00041167AB|nr:helix-turn-helix domain-containing protein [Nitratidesulfovibrio termitidis]